MQPIYELTSKIYIKIGTIHKSGEEQGKIGGAAELLL